MSGGLADSLLGACVRSKRADAKHSWVFDGDDPYTICVFCGERRDALTGRAVTLARPSAAAPGEDAAR